MDFTKSSNDINIFDDVSRLSVGVNNFFLGNTSKKFQEEKPVHWTTKTISKELRICLFQEEY